MSETRKSMAISSQKQSQTIDASVLNRTMQHDGRSDYGPIAGAATTQNGFTGYNTNTSHSTYQRPVQGALNMNN